MAINRPDTYRPSGPFSIVWANETQGGHHQVDDTDARNAILADRRAIRMLVSYNDGTNNVTKRYVGTNVLDPNWQDEANWEDIGGDTGGLGGTIPEGTTVSVDVIGAGTEYNVNTENGTDNNSRSALRVVNADGTRFLQLVTYNADGTVNRRIDLRNGDIQFASSSDSWTGPSFDRDYSPNYGDRNVPDVGYVRRLAGENGVFNLFIESGATTPPFNTHRHFRTTLTADLTINNPTGATPGATVVFEIYQDATGGHSVSWGSNFRNGTDAPVSVSTTANSYTLITGIVDSNSLIVITSITNITTI